MKDKLVPFLVVLVVLAAFAVGMMYGKVSVYEKGGATTGTSAGTTGDTQQAAAPIPDEVELTEELWNEIITDPVAAKGPEDAAVTMVEFTDYQCPFCSRFYSDTYESTIAPDYVDSGKIRYVVRDLPLSFHPYAKNGAVAARCSGEQDKYFEMHDMLFAKQDEWTASDPKEVFEGYASDMGLNVSAFATCYESGKFDEAINSDLTLAAKVGATGTPTFFINGTKVVGAQPTTVFTASLDGALGE
jgi:protein-disulfide isomerase